MIVFVVVFRELVGNFLTGSVDYASGGVEVGRVGVRVVLVVVRIVVVFRFEGVGGGVGDPEQAVRFASQVGRNCSFRIFTVTR